MMIDSDSDAVARWLIKEDQLSTQRCLQICHRLTDHIDQIQITSERSNSTPRRIDSHTIPKKVTDVGLQEGRNSITLAETRRERHILESMN